MSLSTHLKPWSGWIVIIVILFSLGLKAYNHFNWPERILVVHDQSFKVLVADSYAHQVQGLSDRNGMGKYAGMWFAFPTERQHTMVMRRMRFPLDIVWIKGEKVVDLAPNLQPEKGVSEESLKQYPARETSTAVFEAPAGFIAQNKLRIGDTVLLKMEQ